MPIKIEKDVPVPPITGANSEVRTTIKKMKPGESVLVPQAMRGAIITAAKEVFGKGNYTSRSVGKNVRVWRLK